MDLLKKLQEEITILEYELRNELPKEILRARELGDLKENAEFHAAKARQSYVDARIAQLRKRLQDLSMVDMSKIPHDRIGLGSTVVVLDLAKDVEITYKLVTSEEADATKGMISTSSPIGKGLLGKVPGDETSIPSPGGVRKLEVLSMKTIYESQ